MRSFLEAIKLPKYIFTNADIKHAEICLQLMGLDNVFDVRLSVSCLESLVHNALQIIWASNVQPALSKHEGQAACSLFSCCLSKVYHLTTSATALLVSTHSAQGMATSMSAGHHML